MAIYLTFDIGTTSLKTALIDENGRAIAVKTAEYKFSAPRPDWAEMLPKEYWNAAVNSTRKLLDETGISSSQVKAIGFSSQGQTFVPIDRNGNPLYNAIVWVDNRAQAIADEWEASWLSEDEYRRITGYPGLPSSLTIFEIAWLAKNAPEAHSAWKFLCLPDYMIYRMTGETVTDQVIAHFSGIYNLQTRQWEPRLLNAAGISADQLPKVLKSGEIGGYLSNSAADELGITAGIPVCVGANDQIAGAVGAGNTRPGIVTETTGTSLALIATTPTLLDDTGMIVGRHADPDMCFAMPMANTSAIVLKWFRDICGCDEGYDTFLKAVEDVPAGSEGLTVLPHFSGTASPTFNPSVRGAIIGLALGHTRAHISRAIMESCCCMLKECLDLITGHGLKVDIVRSLGGAARSNLWLQMKADMLGIPVELPECTDAAAVGAALLAAVGTGQFTSIGQASKAWYRPSRVFEPNKALHSCYQEVYERYLAFCRQLYSFQSSVVSRQSSV